MNKSYPLLILFLLNLVWTMSIFIAPYTIPAGTVTNLDGNANRVDYADLWNNFSLYPKIVYYFGDLNCHQKHYRTFQLNNNQLPVCVRDTAIFTFVNFGFLIAMHRKPSRYLAIAVLNLFPEKYHEPIQKYISSNKLLILFIGVMVIPIGIDGGLQLFTNYESTTFSRIVTGALLGFNGSYLMGAMLTGLRV